MDIKTSVISGRALNTPWLRPHPHVAILEVYVRPSSSLNEICGEHGGRLKIKIKSPPEDGKANLELVSFLALILKIPKNKMTLIKGESSRQKCLLVELSVYEIELMIKANLF